MAKESEELTDLVVDPATERGFLAQAILSIGSPEYEQEWRQEAEHAAKLVPPEKLAEDKEHFIIDSARLFWLMESLIDEEEVQNRVAGELLGFYPEFTKNMLGLHEKNPEKKPEFVLGFIMWMSGKWHEAREPWYAAVRFHARSDKRFKRIKGYVADGVRSRVKPFPPFYDWYREALAHPPLGSSPGILKKYHKKKYGEYISQVKEELTENKLVETFFFHTEFRPQLSDHGRPRLRRKNLQITRQVILSAVFKALEEGKTYKGVLAALDEVDAELTVDPLFQKWQSEYEIRCWTDIGKHPKLRARFQKWLSDQKNKFPK